MVDMSTLVGTFRRFGPVGPTYEILGTAPSAADGQPQMRIHVFESDEEADYPLKDILEDPVEG